MVCGDMLQCETLQFIVVDLGKLKYEVRCKEETIDETQTPHIVVVARGIFAVRIILRRVLVKFVEIWKNSLFDKYIHAAVLVDFVHGAGVHKFISRQQDVLNEDIIHGVALQFNSYLIEDVIVAQVEHIQKLIAVQFLDEMTHATHRNVVLTTLQGM